MKKKQWYDAEEAMWGVAPKYPDVPKDWVDPQLKRALDSIDGNLLLEQILEAHLVKI